MNRLQDLTKNKIKDIKQEKEKVEISVKSHEFEKNKFSSEFAIAMKQFRAEKEKERMLNESVNARKNQIQRLNSMLKETNSENEELRKNNIEV